MKESGSELQQKGISPAKRLIVLRTLSCFSLYYTLVCVFYRTAAASVLPVLLYCTLQGWQQQLRGHTEAEKSYKICDIGLSLDLLAELAERLLAKLSLILGNGPPPL